MKLLLLPLLLFAVMDAQQFTFDASKDLTATISLVNTVNSIGDLMPPTVGRIFKSLGGLFGFGLKSDRQPTDYRDRLFKGALDRVLNQIDNLKHQLSRSTSKIIGHMNQLKVTEAHAILDKTWGYMMTYLRNPSRRSRSKILEECQADRPRAALHALDTLTSTLMGSMRRDIEDNYYSIRTHVAIDDGRKPIYMMAFAIENFCRAVKYRNFNADFDSEILHLKSLTGRIDTRLNQLRGYAKKWFWSEDKGLNSLARATIDSGDYSKKTNRGIARDVLQVLQKHYPWYTWAVLSHNHRGKTGGVSDHSRAVSCHGDTMRHIQHRDTDLFVFCTRGSCNDDERCKGKLGRLRKDTFQDGRGTLDGNKNYLRWECHNKYSDWAKRVFEQHDTWPKCWLLVSHRWNPAIASASGASLVEDDIHVKQNVRKTYRHRQGSGIRSEHCGDDASFFAPYLPWR